MKTKSIYLSIAFLVAITCNGSAEYSAKGFITNPLLEMQSTNMAQRNDTLLNNIEQKVYNAFVKSVRNQNDSELVSIENALLELNSKKTNSIIVYWYSYACYYHSIFSLRQNDLKKTEKMNVKGIEKLEEVEPKNSEHFALLALMQSLSFTYAPGSKAPFISTEIKKNAEKALELDPLNPRAYYVLGSNDFYTPEQYGGGNKAEGYLKKSIELKNQAIANPYLPSWGKSLAYELIIRFYLKKNLPDEANKYYQQAKILFPNDYLIKKLGVEMEK